MGMQVEGEGGILHFFRCEAICLMAESATDSSVSLQVGYFLSTMSVWHSERGLSEVTQCE